ncbi:cysteine desulfurase NifS [Desulfoplanes formicivorans]|uniref:Cysteine desulfurase n=1 Tax=Desulfoplanes formicivorans TaxID=1592317 RepID=A0A194AKQ2_9BACT|nr:cysteine desulfurase NifS [Desulfoplanes formicivorans]GAU09893.1 cysteine desulfurase [Desulfoplanes formicivorans]
MNKVIYMDNNATTRVAPQVIREMLPVLETWYGNPSSMHGFGGAVGKRLDQARKQVADLLQADPGEIVFTSGGTESDNTAILAALASQPHKRHIVTTRVEHPAVLSLVKDLEERGYTVTWLGVDRKGHLNPDAVRKAVRKDTAIVSVMAANNETGVLFPIDKIAAITREKDVLLHTDAVQIMGKLPFSVQDIPVDFLSLSSHKIHGPKGVGALYVRKGVRFKPFIIGGHQEHGRRAGTENIPGIVGLGKACQLAARHLDEETIRVGKLRDRLEEGLLSSIDHSQLNGDQNNRLPNTTSIAFEFVEGEAILLLMNELGICASSGSACTSGSLEPSHVLRAMGIPFTYAHGSIRFSLSRYTTDQEVDTVIRELPPIIARLRELSPFC